jgi:hypothetical protein
MNERLEDRFELLSRLGGGSGGEVYRVRELATGQIKALKVMDARNAAIPGAEARFRNECTGLDHEYLIRVDEVVRLSGNLCLVMELVEGDSLETIIAEHWNLPVEEKILFLARVCRGLDVAHRSGRVHRDIKPSNILRQRRNGAPKIIDFGVAKRMGEHGPTVQGTVVGTFAYMSPEQVQGLPVDARSDIFSAAVVLYEFLSGICPFDSDGEYQTKEKIVRGPSPQLPVNLAGIPAPLHGVLLRALEKDLTRRFQTAGEMADALEACAEARRTERELRAVVPPTVQLAPQPILQPEPVKLVTTAPEIPAPTVPAALLATTNKPRGKGWMVAALLLVVVVGGGVWAVTHGLGAKPRTPAELYFDGMEKRKAGNQAAALDLWSQACAGQIGAACTEAGLIKINGLAGYTDALWAVRFFQRGCDLNHPWSCSDLGSLYQKGLGVEANRTKAAALYMKGCKGGDQQGCTLLAQLSSNKLSAKKLGKNKPEDNKSPGFTLPQIHWDQLPWNNQKPTN